MNQRPTRGMVLGKFMPPHAGHRYLFEFARNYVDQLSIVVETQQGQAIAGELRYRWVRAMMPDVDVVHLTDENPQDPSEHPDFWEIWRDSLTRVLPYQPDFLFASEEYGWKLAEVMGCQFIPVDIDRTVMPVSGTAVREDPLKNWEYIPRIARPYFAKRVCIFGPESTGKSTLTKDLAAHYDTCYVPEYARIHLESRGGKIQADDIDFIARGQVASEEAIAFDANRVMFCDTDLITTSIWSEWLFEDCPQWVRETAKARQYDLYLVTDIDVPWVEDSVRYLPEERQSFLDRCIDRLQQDNRNFLIVSGSWEDRLQIAIDAVDGLLSRAKVNE